jgi:6-phosphogluconolactonase (cycloisomerase 2 family)
MYRTFATRSVLVRFAVVAGVAACGSEPTAPPLGKPLYVVTLDKSSASSPHEANHSVAIYAGGATGNVTPTARITESAPTLTDPWAAIALDTARRMYVGSRGLFDIGTGPYNIVVYAPGATGKATPTATIGVAGLIVGPPPVGFALDAKFRLYVADFGYSCTPTSDGGYIAVYTVGAAGTLTSLGSIAGSRTSLCNPTGSMAFDAAGRLYVLNRGPGSGSITVYAAGATGDTAPAAAITGSNTGLKSPSGIAVDGTGRLYVTNTGDSSIKIYAAGATGNVAPVATIAGNTPGLVNPAYPTFDAAGRLYVANTGAGNITVFAPGATGNATPTAIVAGSNTGLNGMQGIAVDAGGQLYANNRGDDPRVGVADRTITVYAAGATGNAAPAATILFRYGWLIAPRGIARDPSGRVYLANGRPYNRIIVYAAGASGDATPTDSIAGSNTGLSDPQGIALDATGRLYVANGGDRSIRVYAAGATGNATPIATIAGSNTGLNAPTGIAVDSTGQVYVANRPGTSTPDAVTVYAAGATGNVTPKATITGSATGLSWPFGVVLDAAGRLYVANESCNSGGGGGFCSSGTGSITVYAAGATGNATPVAVIAGGTTGLLFPRGLALGSGGWLYVANYGGHPPDYQLPPNPSDILVFAPGVTGNAAPAATIAWSSLGPVEPTFLTF